MTAQAPKIRSLSPSKIEAAMKCPEQMRLRYAEKVPEPNLGSLAAGTIVHAVLEWALKRVREGQPLPGKKEADDYFIHTWEQKFAEEESKQNFFAWAWQEGDSCERAYRECRDLIPFALQEVLPSVKPKLIEEDVKLFFDSPVGKFMVWGKLDLMEEDSSITDWKTALKEPSANQKKMGMGIIYYSFKSREHGSPEIVPARKIFLIRSPKPSVEVASYTVGVHLRKYFARVAAEVWKMCVADAFVPNTSSWICKPDWCSFYGPCQGELE